MIHSPRQILLIIALALTVACFIWPGIPIAIPVLLIAIACLLP